MSIRKGRIAIAAGLLLVALQAGCSPDFSEGSHRLFRPGEKWLLTYRAELAAEGVAVSTTRMGDELVERVETPFDRRSWALTELPVAVSPAQKAGHVNVLMTIQRMANRSYDDDQPPTTAQDTASPLPDEADQQGRRARQELVAVMESLKLSATLDKNGRVVALDPQGEMFAGISIEELKKEAEAFPAAKGFSTKREVMAYVQRQYDWQVRLRSMGAYSALEAAAPYLPTEDVVAGDIWLVHREKVYPGQFYAFYMITNGAMYSSERATCVVKSVEEMAEGRLVTVEITGRRVPGSVELDIEVRVDFLELTGELVFNLDTREIVTLRIATDPHFVNEEDANWRCRLVDTISLQRVD